MSRLSTHYQVVYRVLDKAMRSERYDTSGLQRALLKIEETVLTAIALASQRLSKPFEPSGPADLNIALGGINADIERPVETLKRGYRKLDDCLRYLDAVQSSKTKVVGIARAHATMLTAYRLIVGLRYFVLEALQVRRSRPSIPKSAVSPVGEVNGRPFLRGVGDARDIDVGDVYGGNWSECYLVSVLASIARWRPEEIRKRIRANLDGSYTVRLANKSVRIDGRYFPVQAGGRPTGIHSMDTLGRAERELWPTLFEQAWAKHQKIAYDELSWGSAEDVLQKMFGASTSAYFLAGKPIVWIRGTIEEAVRRKNAVVFMTSQHGVGLAEVERDGVVIWDSGREKLSYAQLRRKFTFLVVGRF